MRHLREHLRGTRPDPSNSLSSPEAVTLAVLLETEALGQAASVSKD
jgi:hypothetical protein